MSLTESSSESTPQSPAASAAVTLAQHFGTYPHPALMNERLRLLIMRECRGRITPHEHFELLDALRAVNLSIVEVYRYF